MPISRKEVKHIASLARLKLRNIEVNRYQKELTEILDYVDKLKEVKIRKQVPKSNGLRTIVRQDKKVNKELKGKDLLAKNYLKENYLKVPLIFRDNET